MLRVWQTRHRSLLMSRAIWSTGVGGGFPLAAHTCQPCQLIRWGAEVNPQLLCGGIMPNGDISQAPRWKALYNVAIEESNTTKLPRLLDNAIDAVLSRIEDV